MKVLVFGGASDVGEHILKQLTAKQHQAITISETENEAQQLKDAGATDVIIATDENLTRAYDGCDAVIFAAGASPLAGESKDMLVDHEAFKKSVEDTKKHGIDRFVFLSAVRSDESEEAHTIGDKEKPEEILTEQGLTYTIIRPVHMVKKPGKGTVKTAASLKKKKEQEIPYEDVGAFLVELLDSENSFQKKVDVTAGNTPITKAVEKL